MAQKRLRHDMPHPDSAPRFAVGISVASTCRGVKATLINAVGRGLGVQLNIQSTVSLSLGESLVARLRKLTSSSKSECSVEAFGQVRAELAEIEAESIQRLCAEAAIAPSKIFVIGVDDPGLWSTSGSNPSYVSLCDAARIAETTGISVVDAFPARDLAQGGQGGPIGALPQWVLFKDTDEDRLLVDLGRTTRMTFLPAESSPMANSRILSFDVGPGTWLLDDLTSKLTGGQNSFDPGGRFAVQGQRLDALLEHWLADYALSRSAPRWHPRGIRPERFLNEAIGMAVEADWSVQDLLCTATHLIAEAIARAIRERLPDDLLIDRILLTGGGQHNGMLLREITARLPDVAMSRIDEFVVSDDALAPICAALLALFHIDQVPGNIGSVTGAEVPRVLGRLTPGSPQSWQRLMHSMAGAEPTLRPLRSVL